jgi:WD40 repeat protein
LDGPVLRAQFGPGDRVVAVSSSGAGCFDTPTGAFLYQRRIAGVRRAAVASGDEAVIVFCGAIERRAVFSGNAVADWSRPLAGAFRLTDLTTTPGGRVVIATAHMHEASGCLEVLDPADGRSLDTISITSRPHRVACSADGTLAATLAHGHLSVWNLRTRTPVVERTAAAHGGWLSVAFAPHGRRIVTGGIDSAVAVWDAATNGPPLTTFQWGVGPVYAVAFDRDGLRAAAAGHSGAIVWDADE